ncbi:MAG: bifunctional (p)ppGpp synthetase/guanosine-3',5'-bis(diphosphate) 3'-pyrophosphohydrolase, partial [Bacteroidetes bacterium]
MKKGEMTTTEQDQHKKAVINAYRRLMRAVRHRSKAERAIIRRAFEFARDAHEGTRRKSGEPYILHPLAVAQILAIEMGLDDPTTIVCALLHDVVEDTHYELIDIKREFGVVASNIIDGLTKISVTELGDKMDSTQAENFRKIFLTISDDIRVILIKLADRLHNMRTLGAMRQEKVLKIASETIYLYAPLAHRLGLYSIKSELEDLSFKYSEPVIYEDISRKMAATEAEARQYIEKFTRSIRQVLRQSGLKFKVKSRFKSVYSVWQKMERKGLPFEEIYDLFAVRIILETRPGHERDDCWRVYSIISGLYRPNPKRLRDWITVPKENGYEALHTTLLGPDGRWVEVQIRTERMDYVAEKGIAAHWKYKENGERYDEMLTEWIGRVRDILENPRLNALDAINEFRENLAPNDVYVFTPKGELIRLPNGSTVIDFAYKIHTGVGDTAIGAKVNNQVVTLDHELRPGDQVEVLTSKKQKPQQAWLRFAKSVRAKEAIKSALRKQKREIIEQGRRLFQWKARQYGVDEDHPYMKELLAYFMLPSLDEFFYALGSHRIDTSKITEFIKLKKEGKQIDSEYISEWEKRRRFFEERLEEFGVNPDMLVLGDEQDFGDYVLAKCCDPLPGDDILGFNEKDRIVIHRTSCPRAISLMSSFGSRIVKARWAADHPDVAFL